MERKSSASPNGERVNNGSVNDGSVATEESEKCESTHSFNPYRVFCNAKIITVEPLLFFFTFGRSLFVPLIQQYFFNLYALDELKNTSYPYFNKSMCLYKSDIDTYVSSEAYKSVEYHSNMSYLYISIANGILSIFSTLIMGPISDKYGRRLVLIVVSVGALIQGLNTLVVVQFNLSLYFLIPGVAICGMFGDFVALVMASFSYISDVSSKERRTVRLGLAECTVFLAALLSGGLGGIWFKKVNCNFISPLLVITGCNIVVIIYTLFLLPANERKTRDPNSFKGFKLLARGYKIFLCMVKEYPVWKLWTSIISIMIVLINIIGSFSILVLFLKALNWGPDMIGVNSAISQAFHLVVLVVVLPVLVALKLPDSLISLIGAIFSAGMNLCIGLSQRPYQLFIFTGIQGMDALILPPLRSTMSKSVSVEDQGALFSVLASAESLSSLVAGIIFPLIFPITLNHDMPPGTVFMMMAALGMVPILIISFMCFIIFMKKYSTENLVKEASEKKPLIQT